LWRELLAFIFLISSIVISSNIIRFEWEKKGCIVFFDIKI
jgi:hypothetical protein